MTPKIRETKTAENFSILVLPCGPRKAFRCLLRGLTVHLASCPHRHPLANQQEYKISKYGPQIHQNPSENLDPTTTTIFKGPSPVVGFFLYKKNKQLMILT